MRVEYRVEGYVFRVGPEGDEGIERIQISGNKFSVIFKDGRERSFYNAVVEEERVP